MSRGWVAAAVLLAACGQQAGRSGSGIVSGTEPGGGTGQQPGTGQSPGLDPDGGTIACVNAANVVANSNSGPPPELTCSELLPVLGEPVEHRFTEVTDDPEGRVILCNDRDQVPYPASGLGTVLHRAQADQFAGFVADDSGATIGTFGAPVTTSLDVFANPFGWDALVHYPGALGTFPVVFLDADGSDLTPGPLDANAGFAWPTGVILGEDSAIPTDQVPAGCGDASGRAFTFRLVRYDTDGHVTGGPTDAFGCFDQEHPGYVVRVDTDGSMLVLIYGGPSATTRAWRAMWLDSDLTVLNTWTPVGLPADGPYPAGEIRMGELVDQSIVISVDGAWRFRVPNHGTSLEPVPCWLANRPGTSIDLVQKLKAYALTSQPTDGSCKQVLEIVKADGTSCGFADLGTPPERCAHGVAIGPDGTVTGSPYAVDAGAGAPRSCVQPFWPRPLGRSQW